MHITEDKEQLISRFLNGVCNSKERIQLLEWINQSEENKNHYLSIKDTWDASLNRLDSTDKELLNFYKNQAGRNSNSQKSLQLWRWSAGLAAILAIGLVFKILFNQPISTVSNLVTYSVPLGSKSQLILADGTVVDLNSGSTLQYSDGFNSEFREVTLSGEAYFDVSSDESNPFIVKTTDFNITVTGTQFNVCSYSSDDFSSASLLEGKITLSASNIEPLELNAGEKIELNREAKTLCYVSLDPEAEIAWKKEEFVFNKITFPNLVKKLERWFDVKINYDNNEMDSLSYTGNFKNQETIWQVLDALKLTTPIDYKRKNFREFDIKRRNKQ